MKGADNAAWRREMIAAINRLNAENRALRTVLQTMLLRIAATNPQARPQLARMRDQVLALLAREADQSIGEPDQHRADQAAHFHAEALFADLTALLEPPASAPGSDRQN